MTKHILRLLISLTLGLFLLGVGKLYISYNLARYAGYYVQQLPRKEGTNPELVILIDYLFYIDRPEKDGITYDMDGNGTIRDVRKSYYMGSSPISNGYSISIYGLMSDELYLFNKKGKFHYYVKDTDFDNPKKDDKYRLEGERIVSEMLFPVLKGQKKPAINLQFLFDKKHYKRFN